MEFSKAKAQLPFKITKLSIKEENSQTTQDINSPAKIVVEKFPFTETKNANSQKFTNKNY